MTSRSDRTPVVGASDRRRAMESAPRRRSFPLRRRGGVMLFVLLILALAAALAALISAGLRQQLAFVRIAADERLLNNLGDSARSWAEAHPESLKSAHPTKLDARAFSPEEVQGEIILTPLPSDSEVHRLRVSVNLLCGSRRLLREWEYPLAQ